MKDLLISHISDIDGISPVILLKLSNIKFDYELKEIYELDDYFNILLDSDLSIYNNIYVTDLTLNKEIYEKINNSSYKNKFKVFDHHMSHLFANEYDYVNINIEESGTSLFYIYLCQNKKLNKRIIKDYVEHVKNLDLWLFEKKSDFIAKQLGDLLGIYGRERYIEEIYTKLKKNKKFRLNEFELKILQLEQDKITRYIEKKEKDMYKIKIDNYYAGLIISEKYNSEMGNTIAKKYPDLDFIIMINLSGGISFRTIKDVDLSVIAKKYNGGGHKAASGAPIPIDLKLNFIKQVFKGCEIIDEDK